MRTGLIAVIASAVLWPTATHPNPNTYLGRFDAAAAPEPVEETIDLRRTETARILLVGDVMLGRGVAPVARRDPDAVFEAIQPLIESADVAGANLESPLTLRAHIAPNQNALEAHPASASILARAGFDVVSIANNHAGDAGRGSIADTIDAMTSLGISVTGGGLDADSAHSPTIFEVNGLTIAFLGYDLTRAGTPVSETFAGILHWDTEVVVADVQAARRAADIVVVSVHGGVEYSTNPDPTLVNAADVLLALGVDVMWGHHTHVRQPVASIDDAVVATGLGNALFDQPGASTTTGGIVETIVDAAGVRAFRSGSIVHPDRTVRLDQWDEPTGPAVWIHDSWWTWLGTPVGSGLAGPRPSVPAGEPVAWATGDVTGDGAIEIVVAVRENDRRSRHSLDAEWAKHLSGTYRLVVLEPTGTRPIWSGEVDAVADLEVCDSSVGLAHGTGEIVAWTWEGGELTAGSVLRGHSRLGCVDADGDLLREVATLPSP